MRDAPDTRDRLLDAAFAEVYRHGYHGASTAAILKQAGVPKGSMYHFFPAKKSLVLAVVEERIFPRMDAFYDFRVQPGSGVVESLRRTFDAIASHALLVESGCPMHRLMVEMAPLDETFAAVLERKFDDYVGRIADMLASGIADGQFAAFDERSMARFIITATWGELSLSPALSSSQRFGAQMEHVVARLESMQLDHSV